MTGRTLFDVAALRLMLMALTLGAFGCSRDRATTSHSPPTSPVVASVVTPESDAIVRFRGTMRVSVDNVIVGLPIHTEQQYAVEHRQDTVGVWSSRIALSGTPTVSTEKQSRLAIGAGTVANLQMTRGDDAPSITLADGRSFQVDLHEAVQARTVGSPYLKASVSLMQHRITPPPVPSASSDLARLHALPAALVLSRGAAQRISHLTATIGTPKVDKAGGILQFVRQRGDTTLVLDVSAQLGEVVVASLLVDAVEIARMERTFSSVARGVFAVTRTTHKTSSPARGLVFRSVVELTDVEVDARPSP